MVLNCLSQAFSFTCRRKKKRSDIFRKSKEDSEIETLSNCTAVSNNEKKEEDSDIIDSYSKSNNSKIKIKKSIQVNKEQLKRKPKTEQQPEDLLSSSTVNSNNSEIIYEERKPRISKNNLTRNERTKIKSDSNSTIEDLSNSLKKLNMSRKKHKLIKLRDHVKDVKNTKNSETEHRKTNNIKIAEKESPNFSQSISSISDERNFLNDVDVRKNTRKASKVIDSDSEIWFLKNKNENLKFNHNLRMKMVEYLIKKSSK